MSNLVLSRRAGESIVVSGPCVLKVLRIRGDTVRLAIEAEPSVRIMRSEIEGRDQGDRDGQNPVKQPTADHDGSTAAAGPAGAGD